MPEDGQSIDNLSIDLPSFGGLKYWLSPDAHPSLSLSCADKLIQSYADQILSQKELAIAYPCLNCLGGLSLFLAYMMLSVETDSPGRPISPVLVYPGTSEIREAYMALKIRIDDLLKGLKSIRIMAYKRSGSPRVYPWEQILLKKVNKGKIGRYKEYPLHDFFPAAVIDGSSNPRLLAGRHGFGRGDDSPPPLQFSTRIDRLPSTYNFRAAILMHDALNTHAERRRLRRNLNGVVANSIIHLFESPYSPNFRILRKRGCQHWRIRPRDWPHDGKIFLEDDEILNMLDTKPRVHFVSPPLSEEMFRRLIHNFGRLRKSAMDDRTLKWIYGRFYNLYRFILTLPVPHEDYDKIAESFGCITIEERFENIQEEISALAPVDYSLCDDSLQIILSMKENNRDDPSRARAVLTEVERAMEKGQSIGVVISNEVYGMALERFLSNSLGNDPLSLRNKNVNIVQVSNLRYIVHPNLFDVILYHSYRGGNIIRWIMSGKSKEAVVLATPYEKRALERDLEDGVGGKDTWSPQRKTPYLDIDDKPETKLVNALGRPTPSLPTIPFDDGKFVQGLHDYMPSRYPDTEKDRGPVQCKKITFRSHFAYLPIEGMVTIVTNKGTKECSVKNLKREHTVMRYSQ